MKLQFTLNGRPLTIEVDPSRRAVDLLRDDLKLTGTKESCGSGECGACGILVDGISHLSCLMLAAQLEGRRVNTIEGIAADSAHSPLLHSFVRHGAVQCGYCSPGMVVAAVDFLSRNPKPRRPEIRTALSGNLCRCTGYQKIVDAVSAAAAAVTVDQAQSQSHASNNPLPAPKLPALIPARPNAEMQSVPVLLPRSAAELLETMSQVGDYRLLAGGTDLLVWRRDHPEQPRPLIGLERVPELREITLQNNEIVIGAAATFQQILDDPLVRHLDPLVQAIRVLGSPPILHMATIGGNLCTASPAADSLPPLYVLRANVELRSANTRRVMPIEQFITGPRKTHLQPGEVLWAVRIPVPEPGLRGGYFKVGLRKALAIAVASLAAAWTLEPDGSIRQIHLAWGSVGPTVLRFPEIENELRGRRMSLEVLKPLTSRIASLVVPIDDLRASAAYRRQVAGNMLLKLLGT